MRRRSLRARLTLWYTSLLTVTFLVLGGVAYGLLVYSLAHDVDAALRGVAQALANQAQQGPSAFFPADIEALFRRSFGSLPWDRYFELRDPFGRRDPRWPRPGKLPLSPPARRISAAHLVERLEETGAGDELDRLAHTLNAMLGRLDDAFRQIRQFSADASHELQTPVTILKGELEVALRLPRSPEAYQRHLYSALEEVERIATLVDGLLLLARADAGVLRMDCQPVDLGKLVEEVMGQSHVLAAARRVTVERGPMEPAMIQGDYERLRRLLLNLVDNGLKYTPPGGRVTLSLHRHDAWASLQVADTGIGLSVAEQEQIFQRFYRADSARASGQGGAGLGLCIAQSIAEAHGGRIHIDSTPGGGSTFTVCLPWAVGPRTAGQSLSA